MPDKEICVNGVKYALVGATLRENATFSYENDPDIDFTAVLLDGGPCF